MIKITDITDTPANRLLLGARLAELTVPKEEWKHRPKLILGSNWKCVKCDAIKYYGCNWTIGCNKPDPIQINWETAMTMLRDLRERRLFTMHSISLCHTYRPDVSDETNRSKFWQWVGKGAIPFEILRIVCITLEKGKE